MTRSGYTRRRLLAGLGSAAGLAGLNACRNTPAPTLSTREQSPGPTSNAALRRKIASLLIVGFRGQTVGPDDWIVKAIREEGLGGVILFDRDIPTGAVRNISSPAQVTSLVHTLRAASTGRLIVSIDQEGGKTSRLNPSNGFPATQPSVSRSRGQDLN